MDTKSNDQMKGMVLLLAFIVFVTLVGWLVQAYSVSSCTEHTGYSWVACYMAL